MKTEKNFKIEISAVGSTNSFTAVYGKTPKTALAAARRLYPNYDYHLWSLQDNGEWAYEYNIGQHGIE